MKYYDGMGRDVTDYVVSLEQTITDLKAKLELALKESTLTITGPGITGIVETDAKPKPRRRTEQVVDTQ